MKATQFFFVGLIALAVVPASAASLGTEITYQGLLTDGGAPVTGTVDLRFRLFDVPAGGSELETSTVDDLGVSDGRVTATLDFGDEWEGNARWLQVEVRDGSSGGAYTVLPERQELLATPTGLFASDADFASTADHATNTDEASTLDGQNGDFYRAFANLTGVPGGLSDGDDDTAATLSCAVGEMPSWDGAAWVCSPDHAFGYARTAVIGPVGDGSDPVANGAALLAAVGDLPVPTSQEESWLVEVEPGRYELGPSPLFVPPWTTLRGAGGGFTVVSAAVCDSVAGVKAAVILQDRSELHDLAVENTCSSPTLVGRAISILAGTEGVRIGRVNVTEEGGLGCVAVLNHGANAVFDRVVADVPICDGDAGAFVTDGANAFLLDCEGAAMGYSDGLGLIIGARTWVERGLFSGWSTPGGTGKSIYIIADADIRNVIVGNIWVGAYETDQVVTLSRSLISGGPIETSDQGGNLLLVVEHSRIFGAGDTVIGDTNTAIGIAMTQVYGTVSPSGGLIACAGVWDGSWTPYANTCP